MRKIVFAIVIFLAIALIILSFGELETILRTLQHAHTRYLILALVLQGAWFLVSGQTCRVIYHILGLKDSLRVLTLLSAAANFVNVVTPSGGMGGFAVFISDADRRGYSPGKATIAGMLVLFFDYFAFLCVLAIGLFIISRRQDLQLSEIIASFIMLAIAAGLGVTLYLGSKSGDKLGNFLAWLARLINKIIHFFIHRDYLSEERAHEFAHEMAQDLKALPNRARDLILPLSYSFSNKAIMILILAASFMCFEVPFDAGTIIGGFAIAYLFLVVSPTPSGIGIVEGVLPLALSSLRVEWSQAVVVTLTYRFVTFWVPFGIGAWALRALHMNED